MTAAKLKLKSLEKEIFEVDAEVAQESQTIREFLEATSSGEEDVIFPVPIVSSATLTKVIEYCEYHVKARVKQEGAPAKSEDDVRTWDAEFIKVDQATLFDIILAANYLHIKPLLNLSCQTVANAIKGLTPEQIRSQYHLTAEGEEEDEEAPAAKVPRLGEGEGEEAPAAAAAEAGAAAEAAEGAEAKKGAEAEGGAAAGGAALGGAAAEPVAA